MRANTLRTAWRVGTASSALMLALPAAAQVAPDAVPDDNAATGEVVVTATKRGEALRQVAGSVTAVTEQQLDDLNAQSLADYITRVPGWCSTTISPACPKSSSAASPVPPITRPIRRRPAIT